MNRSPDTYAGNYVEGEIVAPEHHDKSEYVGVSERNGRLRIEAVADGEVYYFEVELTTEQIIKLADISYRLTPKPEPLAVGDRVRMGDQDGEILAIFGSVAWVVWAQAPNDPRTWALSLLERA
jgi:hypothetical protein